VNDKDPTGKRTSCPVCGAEAVSIAYGYATSEMGEGADRGEVVGRLRDRPPRRGPFLGLSVLRDPVRAPRHVPDDAHVTPRPTGYLRMKARQLSTTREVATMRYAASGPVGISGRTAHLFG
jgi:hypothetical protein